MAGGIAVFDYNNDGYLDIFFTNGADIASLKKTSPKYANRLFENDGRGHFKDVTRRAGLAGTGFRLGKLHDIDPRDIFPESLHQLEKAPGVIQAIPIQRVPAIRLKVVPQVEKE